MKSRRSSPRRTWSGDVTRLDDSRRGVYLLPNLLTTAGLFCGIFSIAQTVEGAYGRAALALIAAQAFDVLDGRVARLTNTTSRFGQEYDSLCDLVSFGVAPALLVYSWALTPLGAWGWLAPGLFVCCAALRLARFNTMVGHTDSNYFMGLPVPAAAGMLATIVMIYRFVGRAGLPDKDIVVLVATYALAVLMVSSVPYVTGKQFRLHKRQPLWALLAGILMLNFAIASYQIVLFAIGITYVSSGPSLWIYRAIRSWREPPQSGSGSEPKAAAGA